MSRVIVGLTGHKHLVFDLAGYFESEAVEATAKAQMSAFAVADNGLARDVRQHVPEVPLCLASASIKRARIGWRGVAYRIEEGEVDCTECREMAVNEASVLLAEPGGLLGFFSGAVSGDVLVLKPMVRP